MEKLTIIRDQKQYLEYMKRAEQIFHARPGTPESDELDLLVLLIEKYENELYPPLELGPIDVIKVRMSDLGLKQRDLVPAIGNKGNVSKILMGERALTVAQIRKLASLLKVPIDLLVGKPIKVVV